MKREIPFLLLILALTSLFGQEEIRAVSHSEMETLKKRIEELESQIKEIQSRAEKKDLSHLEKYKSELDQFKKEIEEKTGGLQFSGFFDVNATDYSHNPNIFALGDFEFDMEHEIGDHFQIGAALVFNEESSELAVGFIDYHVFGGEISSRGPLFLEKGFHIQVGKFDIPFGNDWEFYASADRPNIFAPLTTETVIEGGYNDTGLRILQASPSFNYALHILKGKEEGNSFGGRLGLTPFSNPFSFSAENPFQMEVGFSYITDRGRDQQQEEEAWCVDLLHEMGHFRLQSEYMNRRSRLEDMESSGYHFTGYYSLNEWRSMVTILILRMEQTSLELLTDPQTTRQKRVSLGINMDFLEVSSIKLEYLLDLDTHDSQVHGQLVVRF